MNLANASEMKFGGKDVAELYLDGRLIWKKAKYEWLEKSWPGILNDKIYGVYVWSDGTNIYHSYAPVYGISYQRQLDPSTGEWVGKNWDGQLANSIGAKWVLNGADVWTDGTYVYLSSVYKINNQNVSFNAVLDKATSTWSVKNWGGVNNIALRGSDIWTAYGDVYFNDGTYQLVLDKATSTWSVKNWNLPSSMETFSRSNVFYVGERVFVLDWEGGVYEYSVSDKMLHKVFFSYAEQGMSDMFYAEGVWTDGISTFFSGATKESQFVLNEETLTWKRITWKGYDCVEGSYIWTDGSKYYFSNGTAIQYVKK